MHLNRDSVLLRKIQTKTRQENIQDDKTSDENLLTKTGAVEPRTSLIDELRATLENKSRW
eukprot:UN13884